jgi:hypothetical protein
VWKVSLQQNFQKGKDFRRLGATLCVKLGRWIRLGGPQHVCGQCFTLWEDVSRRHEKASSRGALSTPDNLQETIMFTLETLTAIAVAAASTIMAAHYIAHAIQLICK